MSKLSLLNAMMLDVQNCNLCCKASRDIPSQKLLRNFIAEQPNGPLFGLVPSIWTDWARRLDAKIAIVGKDWGPWQGPKGIQQNRQRYKEQIERLGSDHDLQIWNALIERYNQEDGTSQNLIEYLENSALLANVSLPQGFIDNTFVTNAVLCARANGQNSSGSDNFDAVKSIRNCCSTRKFLYKQLDIVKPTLVVALGEGALRGQYSCG